MWVFIATEVLFFGALFTAYGIYRHAYAESFASASHRLDFMLGTINTAVLLTSSFTMALAVLAVKARSRRATIAALAATVVLGAIFLGIKGLEYSHEFAEHLAPWRADASFAFGTGSAAHQRLFFNFYFAMTGLHAVHLVVGIGVVVGVSVMTLRRNAARVECLVEGTGLYWHFVDIVWVFLYPMLYLVGR